MAIKTGGGFLNEINVTPFVDVMLVLLIYFYGHRSTYDTGSRG